MEGRREEKGEGEVKDAGKEGRKKEQRGKRKEGGNDVG